MGEGGRVRNEVRAFQAIGDVRNGESWPYKSLMAQGAASRIHWTALPGRICKVTDDLRLTVVIGMDFFRDIAYRMSHSRDLSSAMMSDIIQSIQTQKRRWTGKMAGAWALALLCFSLLLPSAEIVSSRPLWTSNDTFVSALGTVSDLVACPVQLFKLDSPPDEFCRLDTTFDPAVCLIPVKGIPARESAKPPILLVTNGPSLPRPPPALSSDVQQA